VEQLSVAKTDEELVRRAQKGDIDAFDELVAQHQKRVFALAYRLLGNAEDAADVQQETFIRTWSSLKSFNHQAAFTTWLHRITVNMCLSYRRGKGKRGRCVSLAEEQMQTADTPGVEVETSLAVRDALSLLPPRNRALLVLREVEGRSIEEIAEIMGSSVDTCRKQLYRARKLFRHILRSCLGEGHE
jgi:RNA polymerase sigma-70 factor (ECF subfamily)